MAGAQGHEFVGKEWIISYVMKRTAMNCVPWRKKSAEGLREHFYW